MSFLTNKNIVVGITGSIAAYKGCDVVRRLRDHGASVRVIMTKNAAQFITPLTLSALSNHLVHDDLFDPEAEASMGHIALARWADLILVAPATADTIAKFAQGRADDLLSAVILASKAPLAIAPAMNQQMWQHPAVVANCQTLKSRDVKILGPGEGIQACGDEGFGRMLEPMDILKEIESFFTQGSLTGVRVLLTAGPTQEAIDPVRYITNGSSGKMGYALARAARDQGACVTLISGPVALKAPNNVTHIPVRNAHEMYAHVQQHVSNHDIFIGVAAVGDYAVNEIAPQKIAKSSNALTLTLTRTPDIIQSVGQLKNPPFIVGFAAETENVVEKARAKRERKGMDLIIANYVADGMGQEENEVTAISSENIIHFKRMNKTPLAQQLITLIANRFKEKICKKI